MDFGCFVELQGFRTKQEGLVRLGVVGLGWASAPACAMRGRCLPVAL